MAQWQNTQLKILRLVVGIPPKARSREREREREREGERERERESKKWTEAVFLVMCDPPMNEL